MSSLLNEAIVDAKALREAALKNAETSVIEKYSEEVKKTLDELLEQDDLAAAMGTAPAADAEAPAEAPAGIPGLEDAGPEVTEGEEGEEISEDEIPLSATNGFDSLDGKNLSNFPAEGEDVEINIDLGALQEAIMSLAEDDEDDEDPQGSGEMGDDTGSAGEGESAAAQAAAQGQQDKESGYGGTDENIDRLVDAIMEEMSTELEEADTDEDDIDAADAEARKTPWFDRSPEQHASTAAKYKKDNPGGIPRGTDYDPETEKPQRYKGSSNRMRDRLEEDDESVEEVVDAIMEKLTVDMGADLSGWAGISDWAKKHDIEKELARRRSTDVVEEYEDLKKAQEEVVFENNQLKERNSQYKQAVNELKESLQDVNLSNARLLYTNRVLRNTSLNERQKDKIVEAISSAGSVIEARTIYDTLQSTMQAAPKRSPQSLGEAINRRSSIMRATRQESTPSDPLQERMKRLAGIK